MSEARKTFPMSTFVSYVKGGESNNSVQELLAYMTQKDIDAEFEPFAAALAKAWIYEQHPELAKMKTGQVAGLGENVSVGALPGDVMVQVDAIFEKLADYRSTGAEQAAKIKELEVKLAAAEGKLGETEKALAEYKGKCEAFEASGKDEGDKVIVTSQKKVEEYIGKVDELLNMIEDVKKHGVVTVAAGAVAGEAAADAGSAGAPATGGAPAEEFGFGSDPFSDEGW
ncbi:hypothetical protein [Maridesulfovibrio hydrothermalis]|uniref:Uncharacterized protein n=1 Tax=Maridesulfovibrio hydrothermalis AM13 = DSM 14728 TaxID=1121451 RepID=L0RB65_9BACT|nr:hypothetical protein [Maridesulfovibrio hydrothermalis]CCO22826.1 conserved protein of unknown function [Maridesulfovibrio hydrothermalis AM13 = DSM 14728]